MRQVKVRLSAKAQRWFLARVSELADVNPAAAKRLVLRLEALVERLSQFPDMSERGAIPGTRRAVLSRFIVTIRRRGDLVEIVAIRHARQGDARRPPEAEQD